MMGLRCAHRSGKYFGDRTDLVRLYERWENCGEEGTGDFMLKSLGIWEFFTLWWLSTGTGAQTVDGNFILGDFQLSATQGFGQHDLNSTLAQFWAENTFYVYNETKRGMWFWLISGIYCPVLQSHQKCKSCKIYTWESFKHSCYCGYVIPSELCRKLYCKFFPHWSFTGKKSDVNHKHHN